MWDVDGTLEGVTGSLVGDDGTLVDDTAGLRGDEDAVRTWVGAGGCSMLIAISGEQSPPLN